MFMCFGAGFGMRRYINDWLPRVRVFVCRDLKEDKGGRKSLAEKQDASLYRMTHGASTGIRICPSSLSSEYIKVLSTLIIALCSSESYTKHDSLIVLDDGCDAERSYLVFMTLGVDLLNDTTGHCVTIRASTATAVSTRSCLR